MTQEPSITPDVMDMLRTMYPQFDDKQLSEARQHLTAYVAVVLRIHERLEAERSAQESSHDLTDSKIRSTIDREVPPCPD